MEETCLRRTSGFTPDLGKSEISPGARIQRIDDGLELVCLELSDMNCALRGAKGVNAIIANEEMNKYIIIQQSIVASCVKSSWSIFIETLKGTCVAVKSFICTFVFSTVGFQSSRGRGS